MSSKEPEVGDKGKLPIPSPQPHTPLIPFTVSWNWGSGAPGGTVAEKKTSGEVAIKSKRGNTIKKNAEPGNPAIHIERSGNDVVKKASELNVEKKGSGGSGGKKRKSGADEEESKEKEEDATVKNADGKEVRPGGKKAKKEDEKEVNGEERKEKTETKKAGAGRPKKSDGPAKEKKAKKPAKPRSTEGIGSRTRSRK